MIPKLLSGFQSRQAAKKIRESRSLSPCLSASRTFSARALAEKGF
jgi:hypothetical protein